MEVLRTHGVDVAYARAGHGEPLVLAHGAGDDHHAWEPQLTGLSDTLTVVAWDEPGAGASSDVPAGFTLVDWAACLAALVETVGPAIVGGISWGGTVALELFRQCPKLVRALILADTYAGWRGSLAQEEVRARVNAAPAFLAATGMRPGTLRAQLPLMAEADLTGVLPTVDVPTLLIWGEDDARSPIAIARRFQAAIPHAQLVVIPGAGHLSNLDRPAEFNAAVRDFASGISGA